MLNLVALLAEGVDRNLREEEYMGNDGNVALLAEGVDRNDGHVDFKIFDLESPSSRRAWIEMWRAKAGENYPEVALLAEGVDRNSVIEEDGSLPF